MESSRDDRTTVYHAYWLPLPQAITLVKFSSLIFFSFQNNSIGRRQSRWVYNPTGLVLREGSRMNAGRWRLSPHLRSVPSCLILFHFSDTPCRGPSSPDCLCPFLSWRVRQLVQRQSMSEHKLKLFVILLSVATFHLGPEPWRLTIAADQDSLCSSHVILNFLI